MKRIFLVPFLFLFVHTHAQLFESQLANYNPAYTGMMDDRFADFNMSGFGLNRQFSINNFNASYQQNLENINSGFGVNMGYARINFDNFRMTAFYTSLSYRYAFSFENGLRLSAGTRLSYGRFDVNDDNQQGVSDGNAFGAQFGTMADYKNFTLGFALPNVGDGFRNVMINSSYKFNASERIQLSLLSGTSIEYGRIEQNLRIRSDFNQRFWLTTGLRFVSHLNLNQQYFSYGIYVGYRIKQHYHIMLGTDFGFSNKVFSLYNPQIGLVYQWRK
jgi:hypothetical protein